MTNDSTHSHEHRITSFNHNDVAVLVQHDKSSHEQLSAVGLYLEAVSEAAQVTHSADRQRT